MCGCRRPRELLRQPQRHSGDSRRAAWCTGGRRETPQGNELKAPFAELVVTGRREVATRADCRRTHARSYGHFEALLIGTEVRVLVDKTPETMAAVWNREQLRQATPRCSTPFRLDKPWSFGEIVHDFNGKVLRGNALIKPGATGFGKRYATRQDLPGDGPQKTADHHSREGSDSLSRSGKRASRLVPAVRRVTPLN